VTGRSPILGFTPQVLVVLAAALTLTPHRHGADHGGQAQRPAQETATVAAIPPVTLVTCHAPLHAAP
jgi:hypothetical protein